MDVSNRKQLLEEFYIDKIDPSWNDFFFKIIKEEELTSILQAMELEFESYECYPPKSKVFRLFHELPLSKIKVLVIGQDPYHQLGVADGIAFSTGLSNYFPPSLKNIYTELYQDIPETNKKLDGDLIEWVREGVFLINTSLTVRRSQPLTHSHLWKKFISSLLRYINKSNENIIWVSWGREARKIKEECGIKSKFEIFSAHPSPFSAQYGFFGSKPFSKINKMLLEIGEGEIKW